MAHIRETMSHITVPFELVAGNICIDALPAEIDRISVANIDVDMYEPTLAALHKVADLIEAGGLIIAEDATSTPGLYVALMAMDEFLVSENGQRFCKLFKGGQYFLIKVRYLLPIFCCVGRRYFGGILMCQDPSVFPNQGEVPSSGTRYAAYIQGLPEKIAAGMIAPSGS